MPIVGIDSLPVASFRDFLWNELVDYDPGTGLLQDHGFLDQFYPGPGCLCLKSFLVVNLRIQSKMGADLDSVLDQVFDNVGLETFEFDTVGTIRDQNDRTLKCSLGCFVSQVREVGEEVGLADPPTNGFQMVHHVI